MTKTENNCGMDKIREHLTTANGSPWCWLFYGDSITHGAKHTHGWRSFPEIFAERLRWEISYTHDVVINTGISGHNTESLLAGYDWRVRHWHPHVVFVLIGTNDIIKLNDIVLYKSNLHKLLDLIQEDNAIPILQTYPTIQYIADNLNYVKRFNEMPAYNQTIKDVAKERNVILVDHEKYWKENASDPDTLASWLGEPIHPGARGHLEMAKAIFMELGIFDPEALSCNPIGTPFSVPPVK